MRYTKQHYLSKAMTWCFLVSAAVLYFSNVVLHLFLWKSDLVDLLFDLVFPLLVAASLYELEWHTNFFFKRLVRPRRRPILRTIFIVAMTAVLCLLFYDDKKVALIPTVLPLMALAQLPYIFGTKVKRSMAALICVAWLFLAGFALLPGSIAAMCVITVGTPALLLSYPSLSYMWDDVEAVRKQSRIAVGISLGGVLILLATPLFQNAIEFAAMGRPSLWDSHTIAQLGREIFSKAPLWGATCMPYPFGSFEGRMYFLVLAQYGYLAWLFLVLTSLILLASGFYLVVKEFALQKFFVTTAFVLLAIQTIGNLLTCCGIDLLLFPLVTPLMETGLVNSMYLLCVAIILPPRQKKEEEF